MENFFRKITSSFAQIFPAVRAEEEVVDPQTIIRAECQKNHCASYYQKLGDCNDRVLSKKKTAETCVEEMLDFVHCLDHCAGETLMSKLK